MNLASIICKLNICVELHLIPKINVTVDLAQIKTCDFNMCNYLHKTFLLKYENSIIEKYQSENALFLLKGRFDFELTSIRDYFFALKDEASFKKMSLFLNELAAFRNVNYTFRSTSFPQRQTKHTTIPPPPSPSTITKAGKKLT